MDGQGQNNDKSSDKKKKEKKETEKPDRKACIQTIKGVRKYVCERTHRSDESRKCGARLDPTDHSISSHISRQHNDGAYKAASDPSRPVRSCVHPTCTSKGPWKNLNSFNQHLRRVHKGSGKKHLTENSIKKILINRARRGNMKDDPWYNVKISDGQEDNDDDDGSESDEDLFCPPLPPHDHPDDDDNDYGNGGGPGPTGGVSQAVEVF